MHRLTSYSPTVPSASCAAGGKTLVLAEMVGATGRLVVNDRSKSRSARLGRTLAAHVPNAFRRRNLQVTCQDASKWFNHGQHRQVRRRSRRRCLFFVHCMR